MLSSHCIHDNPKPYKGFIRCTRNIPLLVTEMILLRTKGSLPFSLLSLNRYVKVIDLKHKEVDLRRYVKHHSLIENRFLPLRA